MSIGIKLGHPVPPKYVDRFVIEQQYMHGDADAYTKETISYRSCEEVIAVLELLEKWEQIEHNVKCDTTAQCHDEWHDLIDAGHKQTTALKKYIDAIPFDAVYSDGVSWPDTLELFWYDQNGICHNVEITKD